MAQEIPVEELEESVRALTWQRGLLAAAVLLDFFLVAKITGHFVRRAFSKRQGPVFAFSKLFSYSLVFVGLLTSLGLLGLPLSSLVLTSSALLVGVGFSLQHVARDLVAGVVILVEQSLRKNDFVSFGDTTGTVQQIGLRATQLITRDGTALVVPNHLLVTNELTNHSHPLKRTRVLVRIPVAIWENVDVAVEALSMVTRDHPQILAEPPPSVRLEAIEQWGFQFVTIGWVADALAVRRVTSELRLAIAHTFADRGIDFPTPEVVLHSRRPTGGLAAHTGSEGSTPNGAG